MKKILWIVRKIFICVFVCFALISCNTTKKYTLTVEENLFVVQPEKKEYKSGETVTILTYILHDASLEAFLDDVSIGKGESTSIDGNNFWSYSFAMPEHDAILRFKVINGFHFIRNN